MRRLIFLSLLVLTACNGSISPERAPFSTRGTHWLTAPEEMVVRRAVAARLSHALGAHFYFPPYVEGSAGYCGYVSSQDASGRSTGAVFDVVLGQVGSTPSATLISLGAAGQSQTKVILRKCADHGYLLQSP